MKSAQAMANISPPAALLAVVELDDKAEVDEAEEEDVEDVPFNLSLSHMSNLRNCRLNARQAKSSTASMRSCSRNVEIDFKSWARARMRSRRT